jgi:hypothetical protein
VQKIKYGSKNQFQDDLTNEYVFYLKGADTVMASKVLRNDWLEEEVGELAKEGLRTLVVAKKVLTHEQYKDFEVTNHHIGVLPLGILTRWWERINIINGTRRNHAEHINYKLVMFVIL